MEKFLGVDFGGTNVKTGVVGFKGGLNSKRKYPTKDFIDSLVSGLLGLLN